MQVTPSPARHRATHVTSTRRRRVLGRLSSADRAVACRLNKLLHTIASDEGAHPVCRAAASAFHWQRDAELEGPFRPAATAAAA